MLSPMQFNDSRSYLKAVYSDRVSRNKSYSMRAFARAMGLAPSFLHSVLAGERRISVQKAAEISEKLKLASDAQTYFINLVEVESAHSELARDVLMQRLNAIRMRQRRRVYGKDKFSILSKWYYPAILAMSDLTDCVISVESVQKKLGLDIEQANEAIAALMQSGWLEKAEDGSLRRQIPHVLLKSEVTDSTLRTFHAQLLQMAVMSHLFIPPAERITRSETLAINVDQLDKVRKLTENFIESLIEVAQEGDNRTAVFHLNLNFFNLLKKGESS